VKLDDHTAQTFPAVDSPTFQHWMFRFADLDLIYQFPDDKRIVYFVEVPDVNIEKVNAYSRDKNLPYEYSEQEVKVVLEDKSSPIGQLFSDPKLRSIVEDHIIAQKPIEYIAKYGFLCCSPRIGNHLNLVGLYYSHFKKPFEKWDFYDITSGNYPSEEKLKEYKGCVTPGSISSAYDETLTWRPKMEEVYRSIHQNHKHELSWYMLWSATVHTGFGWKSRKNGKVYRWPGNIEL